MEFTINRSTLQKELGFLQGIIERKNTIPVLSNILIESIGETTVRIVGTDMDVTLECKAEAEITTGGALCVNARKLFEIARQLPDERVHFKREENGWAQVTCAKSKFRVAGVDRENFPEITFQRTAALHISATILKTMIDRTIFAITMEESRFALNGAKFILTPESAKMVTTDGHRLAYVERKSVVKEGEDAKVDLMIPRKALAELSKLTTGYEGEVGFSSDTNHIYFELGTRLLIARTLTGQFPNYEMVLPRNNDKAIVFDCGQLNKCVKRVALMSDDRSKDVRFHMSSGNLRITSQSAEEGDAEEVMPADYEGEEVEIRFNSAYLQDFLNTVSDGKVAFEFKDSSAQAELKPADDSDYEYRYVVMPMRL